MSNKILSDNDREEMKKKALIKEKELKKTERNAKIVEGAIALFQNGFFKVGCLCAIIMAVAFVAKDMKIKNEAVYSEVIDWDKLEVAEEDIDSADVEKIEGTIGFDAYLEERKKDEQDSIELAKPVLTSAMYNNLMDGIESKYYYDSVQADYNDVCEDIKSLVKESEYINALYNAYETEIGLDGYDTDKCLGLADNDEKCDLLEVIETFTIGELQEYLLDAHHKWEVLTNYRKEKVNVTEGYTDLLYQDTIVTDLSTVDKLSGRLYVVSKGLYEKGEDAIEDAIVNGKIEAVEFNEQTPESALNQLVLYNSIDFYDEPFNEITADTIEALFAEEFVIDNSEYLGSNLTTEEIMDKISERQVATTSDATFMDKFVPLTFSLTGRNENDIYYLFYEIDNIHHDMNKVETYSSMEDRLIERAKEIEAQKDISAIITAEVQNLDITDAEDVREYFPEFAMTDDEYENYLEQMYNENEGTVDENEDTVEISDETE